MVAAQWMAGTAQVAATGRLRLFAEATVLFLIAWLPFQAPVVAILYQYAGISAGEARLLVLAKDVITAGAFVVLFVALARAVRWSRLDLLAAVYVGMLLIYAVVPNLLGAGVPLESIAASLRTFLIPVELFYLGRLAAAAGVSLERAVSVFLGVAVAAAGLLLAQYLLTSPDFWTSTIDMVRYVREVQGVPGADTLWSISALGHFGVGDIAIFPRAIGTFTHPVGTAHFFLVPLALSSALALSPRVDRPRWAAGRFVPVLLVLLFALAIITPISRGAWIAAVVGLLLVGLLLARVRIVLGGLVMASLFIMLVPPFSYSVLSIIGLKDSSAFLHVQMIEDGIKVLIQSPLGIGAGGSDHLPALAPAATGATGGDSGSVGESMYLATLAVAGPLGFLALLGWLGGVATSLVPRSRPRSWAHVGLFAIFAGMLVSSAIASPLMRFTTAAGFWVLLGLALPTGERFGSLAAVRPSLGRLARRRHRRADASHPAAQVEPVTDHLSQCDTARLGRPGEGERANRAGR